MDLEGDHASKTELPAELMGSEKSKDEIVYRYYEDQAFFWWKKIFGG